MTVSSKYSRLPYVAAMALPWSIVSVNVGPDLAWYKIMPVIMIMIALFKSGLIGLNRKLFLMTVVTSLYILLNTALNYTMLIFSDVSIDFMNMSLGLECWIQHAIVQALFAISVFTQIVFIPRLAKKTGIIDRVLNGYIDGCVVSVLAGLVLIIVMREIRMVGLSGEPRHFSALLVPAVFLLMVNLTGAYSRVKYVRLKLLIIIFGLAASLSTSSIIALLIGMVPYFYCSQINLRKKLLILVSIIFLALVMSNFDFVQEFLTARTQGREFSLDLILYFVPKDALALYFLSENWLYMLFGTGAGAITLHTMQPEFLYSLSNPYLLKTEILSGVVQGELNAVLAPSSFIISYVAQFGIVGLFLLLFLIRIMIRSVNNTNLKASVNLFAYMAFSSCLVMSTIGGVISLFFLAVFFAEAQAQRQRL
jgi:hypothetical protein